MAPYGATPSEWSEKRNIAWKVEIPGRGSASPVVWGDRVFLLTAVPVGDPVPVAAPEPSASPAADGPGGRRGRRARRSGPRAFRMHEFTVLALDRATGDVAWQQVAR